MALEGLILIYTSAVLNIKGGQEPRLQPGEAGV